MALMYLFAICPVCLPSLHRPSAPLIQSRTKFTTSGVMCSVSSQLGASVPSSPCVQVLLNHLSTVPDRGIFGLEDEERYEIDNLIQKVESGTKNNVLNQWLSGIWRVIYTTVEVLGRRRVRLGISAPRRAGLVTLGEMWQVVDWTGRRARNVVEFDIAKTVPGAFEVRSSFEIAKTLMDDVEGGGNGATEGKRVLVKMQDWSLRPERLVQLLGNEEEILLEIFNPEGWLDVTYVDESCRVGRDDKGNVFVLERHLGPLPKVLS